MEQFSVGSCIRFGWETFKKRPWFFIILYLLTGAASYSYRSSSSTLHFTPGIVALFVVLVVIGFFVQTLFSMIETQVLLKAHENVESLSFRERWKLNGFWRFVGGKLLTGLIVICGFILLIVPGIVWSLTYMFVPYLIVDKGLSPQAALKESRRITYGHRWELLGFSFALIGIIILGFVCLIVGLLVAIPVCALATVHAYRTLERLSGETVVPSPVPLPPNPSPIA